MSNELLELNTAVPWGLGLGLRVKGKELNTHRYRSGKSDTPTLSCSLIPYVAFQPLNPKPLRINLAKLLCEGGSVHEGSIGAMRR